MRTRRGFTLVELLVAIAVIGIAFTALAMTQLSGFRVTQDAVQTAVARDVATRQMEDLRALGYARLVRCGETDQPACTAGPAPDEEEPRFLLSWSVSDDLSAIGVPSLAPPPLLDVQVEVTWPDGSYQLGSLLSCADAGASSSTNVDCPKESMNP